MSAGSIVINQGTQTGIQVDTIGGNNYQIVKLDVGALNSSAPFTGTFLGGTVNTGTINTGTINTGTINAGTIDSISQLPPNYFTTTVTSGTNTLGTIKAAVAGSAIYLTDLIVSVGSASNVTIGMGGTSTPFIGTLFFNANSGIICNYAVPGSITSGSALVYQQSANGPLCITATGFVR